MWATLGRQSIDRRVFAAAGEQSGGVGTVEDEIAVSVMVAHEDSLGRRPYERNDGMVPIAAALRRGGRADSVWFSIDTAPPSGRELFFPGRDHDGILDDSSVFKRFGLGSGELTNSLGMTLEYVPPGSFFSGSPQEERGRRSNELLHGGNLTRGFFIGRTEVTQAQ